MDNCIDGQAWSLTGTTGTMAAALAANSVVFAMGAVADVSLATQPNSPRRAPLEIESLQMIFTAIVAGGAAPVGTQVLRLFKGSDNAQTMPSSGTALTALPKRTLDAGGDSGLIGNAAQIAGTAGLTLTGFVRGTVPLATFDLATGGTAIGNRLVFDFSEQLNGAPLMLDPGEILCVSNPTIFQGTMTWSLTVNVDYRRRDSR